MKRRTKKILLGLTLVCAVLAALGWLAAEGRIPGVRKWAERRLVAALTEIGAKPETISLRELTWRRASAGPLVLTVPGAEVRAEEVVAELGWSVLRGDTTPEISLRRARLRVDAARFAELRRWMDRPAGAGRTWRFNLADSAVELRHGEILREVGIAGRVELGGSGAAADLKLSAPELRAQLALRPGGELNFEELAVVPEAWRKLIAAVSPEAGAAWADWAGDKLSGSGSLQIEHGAIARFELAAIAQQLRWVPGSRRLGAATLEGKLRYADRTWKTLEFALTGFSYDDDVTKGLATKADLVCGGDVWRANFTGLDAVGGGLRARGSARAEVYFGRAETDTHGEATLDFSELSAMAWRSDAGSLSVVWNTRDLQAKCASLKLLRPLALEARMLEVKVGGWRDPVPLAEVHARVSAEWASLVPNLVPQPEPGALDVPVSATVSLGRGEESIRAEAKLPKGAWSWRNDANRVALEAGGALTVIADREFVSGRLQVDGEKISLERNGETLRAEALQISAKWPRVWWAAFERWQRLPGPAALREILWVGDCDLNFAGVSGALLPGVECANANLRGRLRGAEVSDESGVDFGLTAESLQWHGEKLNELRLQALGGFDGLQLNAEAIHGRTAIAVSTKQTVSWRDTLAARGVVTLPPTTLTGSEPWRAWWPAMPALTITGTVAGEAQTEWIAGETARVRGKFSWKDGAVHHTTNGASLEGIATEIQFADLLSFSSAPKQQVRFAVARMSGVELRDGSMEFAIPSRERLEVAALQCTGFGGRLSASPFGIDWAEGSLGTTVRGEGVRLEEVLRLFPRLPVRAKGGVSGAIPVRWQDGRLAVGSGTLDLIPGELGLLQLPVDFQPLTQGSAAKDFSTLIRRKIENAMQELHFNRLHIDTYPPEAPALSLRAKLIGAPAGREVIVPVDFDFNVNAPLESFIDWSMRADISLGDMR